MPRLFVALELPDVLLDVLAPLVAASPGVRVVQREQMHLTVHFVGDRDVDEVSGVLGRPWTSVPLDVDGLGVFPTAGGTSTVFAVVRRSDALAALRADVGRWLAPVGFVLEARPWTPHVALARCSPGVQAPEVLAGQGTPNGTLGATRGAIGGTATGMTLWTSEIVDDVPRYRRVRTWTSAG